MYVYKNMEDFMQADLVRTEDDLRALINEGADADKIKKGAEVLEENKKREKQEYEGVLTAEHETEFAKSGVKRHLGVHMGLRRRLKIQAQKGRLWMANRLSRGNKAIPQVEGGVSTEITDRYNLRKALGETEDMLAELRKTTNKQQEVVAASKKAHEAAVQDRAERRSKMGIFSRTATFAKDLVTDVSEANNIEEQKKQVDANIRSAQEIRDQQAVLAGMLADRRGDMR